MCKFIRQRPDRIHTIKVTQDLHWENQVPTPCTSSGSPAPLQWKPTRHPAETNPHFSSNDHCEEGHLKALQAFCPPLVKPFIWILLYISHKTVALFKYIATCLSNICFFIPAEEAQTALNNVLLSSRHISQTAFSGSPEQLRGNLWVWGEFGSKQSFDFFSVSVMSVIPKPSTHLKSDQGRLVNVADTRCLSTSDSWLSLRWRQWEITLTCLRCLVYLFSHNRENVTKERLLLSGQVWL